jgi:hypothetical protein
MNLIDKSTISRSSRLRKYELAYEECIKKKFDNSKKKPIRSEPAKKSRSIRNIINNNPKKSPSIRNVSPKKSRVKKSPFIRNVSPKKSRVKKEPITNKKRSLNTYQKFVKEESKKNKYKEITPSQRMTAISKEWNKQKI